MKFVLLNGPRSAERLQAALNAARAEPDPDQILILTDDIRATPSEPLDHFPCLEAREFYKSDGAFQPLKLAEALKALPKDQLETVLIDASDGHLAVLDQFGNRSGELPYNFMKHYFFRGERPLVVIHFVNPSVLLYSARYWAEWNKYPPTESTYSHRHDDAMNRVAHIIHTMDHLRSQLHPWDRLKRRLWARFGWLLFWRRR